MKFLLDWLDQRTGYRQITREALYENIPGGSRWRYVWGSTLTFTLAVQFITGIFKKEKVKLDSLSIIFCSDSFVLDLNRKFLQHDYYTDILGFPLSAPDKPLQAEIYISLDRVKENAISLDVSFRQELHRVIFHGILHFCGYKDKSAKQIKEIRSLEDRYLKKYGFRLKTNPSA